MGFEVLGIDIEPQPNYPFEFIRADAIEWMSSHMDMWVTAFDAIHASPPCQAHSTLKARWKDREHADLVAPTRELLEATELPYVIENVVGAPLIEPLVLCGSSFGLGVRRHRLFECSFPVMAPPCAHGQQAATYDVYEHGKWIKSPVARVYGHGGGKARSEWPVAMGIDWMSHEELAQAIPPAYTEHIGGYLMAHLNAESERAA